MYSLDFFANASFRRYSTIRRKFISKYIPWGGGSKYKVLFITEPHRIPQSQIFPFFYYINKFEERWNVQFKELNINHLEHVKLENFIGVDLIVFQPWFTKGHDKIQQLLSKLRDSFPEVKIVFFDSFAPTDLRFANDVNPYIDWYVKKHLFLNLNDYGLKTLGDTTLVDYYSKLYNLSPEQEVHFIIPDGFFEKLKVGPTFFTSEQMLPVFDFYCSPIQNKKEINLHARLGAKGSPWYERMRSEALITCQRFSSERNVITDTSISGKKYMDELRSAKMCFSPFGYGEMCWRDYEAILSGSLLIKPDISHLNLTPNAFVKNKTYIPIEWDFSDLLDKLNYFNTHEDERMEIISNAYSLLHRYCKFAKFVDDFAFLFEG